MFDSISEVSQFMKSKSVNAIDLKFADLFGAWHHITLPSHQFSESLLQEGVGFDASATPGFKTLESGDMVIIPDLSTGFLDPFWDDPTLSFICNIAEADTKERFDRDPRYIAEKAEDYLRAQGIATHSLWGPEFEYYIFDSVDFRTENYWYAYKIDSVEAPWNTWQEDKQNLGYQIPYQKGYHAIPPFDTLYKIRSETVKLLEECGINVKYHHHEVGASGQVEIEVLLGPLTRMADSIMITKYIAKMVARKHGKTATFMPKPLYNVAGSGMHFHQHLFKDKEPLFYDANGYGGLSKKALSYIAGILKHAPSLIALTNPSTNSYKRLIPGYEAPVSLFFSVANRSSAIRIPKYAIKPDKKRIEFRTPDATCNPYLAMAGMLMAGINGIENKLDTEKEGFGPFDMNLFEDKNKKILKTIKAAPNSLRTALNNLLQDNEYLLKGDVFRKDLLETWHDLKMQKEYLENRNRPTPYEYMLYYNI